MGRFLFFLIFLQGVCTKYSKGEHDSDEDWLLPYRFHHGPTHSNRYVRDCQPVEHGNVTHEIYPSHLNLSTDIPVIETHKFVKKVGYYWEEKFAMGHKFLINNPMYTISVVEPGGFGGCSNDTRATVHQTAEAENCILAVNAGFFNTTSGACLGDVWSDGREVQSSGGVQNAHFGIRQDGTFFFGYVAEDDVEANHFLQLVGGVLWLIRDGKVYIDESKVAECSDMQESGTLQTFIDVTSARLAVGHNAHGQLVIVQIDGETSVRGVNLYELANLMLSMGVINAVNLDGGGSVSAVLHGQMLNYPGDKCKENNDLDYRCPREVSTVLCVHDIPCENDCNHHGDCFHGICQCHGNWIGLTCELLFCGSTNCSQHGDCTDSGCVCHPGWTGPQCTDPCPEDYYGQNCWGRCQCTNGGICSAIDGSCDCPPGYMGHLCELKCPYSFHGKNCHEFCYCPNSCTCHHVTGSCDLSVDQSEVLTAGQCIADHMIRDQHLVVDQPEQYRLWLVTLICLCIVAAASLILNISLACLFHMSGQSLSSRRRIQSVKRVYRPPKVVDSRSDSCGADDEFQTDSSTEEIPLQEMNSRWKDEPSTSTAYHP